MKTVLRSSRAHGPRGPMVELGSVGPEVRCCALAPPSSAFASTTPTSTTQPSTAPPSTTPPSTAPASTARTSSAPSLSAPPSTAPSSSAPASPAPASTAPPSATPPSTAPPSRAPTLTAPTSTAPPSTATAPPLCRSSVLRVAGLDRSSAVPGPGAIQARVYGVFGPCRQEDVAGVGARALRTREPNGASSPGALRAVDYGLKRVIR